MNYFYMALLIVVVLGLVFSAFYSGSSKFRSFFSRFSRKTVEPIRTGHQRDPDDTPDLTNLLSAVNDHVNKNTSKCTMILLSQIEKDPSIAKFILSKNQNEAEEFIRSFLEQMDIAEIHGDFDEKTIYLNVLHECVVVSLD